VTSVLASEARTGRPGCYGFTQIARAELIKLTTLRSMILTVAVAFAGSIGVTILASATAGHHDRGWYQGFDPTGQSMSGLAMAALAMGVFGAMAATGEYGTGTIRSTLSAAPRRPLLLLAKAAVLGGVVLLLGEVLTFSCFGVGQAILSAGGAPTAALTQPGVLRAVLLSGAFLALLGLLALGLGVIIRHTAGAIATYVGITLLVPILLSRFANGSARYTPVGILANSVSAVVPQYGQLTAPVGMLLMASYTAAVLAVAAVLIVRRDA
jgi:hypothetical protein